MLSWLVLLRDLHPTGDSKSRCKEMWTKLSGRDDDHVIMLYCVRVEVIFCCREAQRQELMTVISRKPDIVHGDSALHVISLLSSDFHLDLLQDGISSIVTPAAKAQVRSCQGVFEMMTPDSVVR